MGKAFNIQLNKIDLIEKHLFRPSGETENSFSFDVRVQSILDGANKSIVTYVEVNIKKEKTTNELAKFLIAVSFLVENFKRAFPATKDKDTGGDVIIADLDNALKNIAISTARGIIFSELRGTFLQQATLPLIAIDSLRPIDQALLPGKRRLSRNPLHH